MAKGGDNIILWLLLLGGGLFYIYHRHDTKEDNGTGPTKTPAAGHQYQGTPLIAPGVTFQHGGHITTTGTHQPPVIIPPSGGFGDCPSCPPGGMQESSYFTYAPGDRVNSWEDLDEHAGMYAVPMQKSYGDVSAIF